MKSIRKRIAAFVMAIAMIGSVIGVLPLEVNAVEKILVSKMNVGDTVLVTDNDNFDCNVFYKYMYGGNVVDETDGSYAATINYVSPIDKFKDAYYNELNALYLTLPDEVKDSDRIYWDLTVLGQKEYSGSSGSGTAPVIQLTLHKATATASLESGTYNTNQTVKLENKNGSTIYYTTDGTDPTEASKVYDGEDITIDKTTTLKLIARGDGMINGDVTTYSYTIDKAVSCNVKKVDSNAVRGKSNDVTALVAYTSGKTDSKVIWSISGNNSNDTKINESGSLVVASDETASTINVKAVSQYDENVSGQITLNVINEPVAEVKDTSVVETNVTDTNKTAVTPKTGDMMPIAMLSILMILASGIVVFTVIRKKKSK